MNKKPLKFIVPRIYKLNDYWFIQWIGNEYYINKNKIMENIHKVFNKYFLIEFLLLILILIISGLFPFRNYEDYLRSFLLSLIAGIQSGFAVIEDRENNNR